MEAIIYTTNTGSAEQYAKILAQETGLPAYSMKEAQKKIRPGVDVICLGWIMAGTIKGIQRLSGIIRCRLSVPSEWDVRERRRTLSGKRTAFQGSARFLPYREILM